jgi:hypothetical protein
MLQTCVCAGRSRDYVEGHLRKARVVLLVCETTALRQLRETRVVLLVCDLYHRFCCGNGSSRYLRETSTCCVTLEFFVAATVKLAFAARALHFVAARHNNGICEKLALCCWFCERPTALLRNLGLTLCCWFWESPALCCGRSDAVASAEARVVLLVLRPPLLRNLGGSSCCWFWEVLHFVAGHPDCWGICESSRCAWFEETAFFCCGS